MAGTPATATEAIEAVIISGERKGELIRLSDSDFDLTPTEATYLESLLVQARGIAENVRVAANEVDSLVHSLRESRAKRE